MATNRSSKAKKATKNRSKRIPSVKRLEGVRPLKFEPMSGNVVCLSRKCPTR